MTKFRRRTFLAALGGTAVVARTASATPSTSAWSAPLADHRNSGHASVAAPNGALGVNWRRSFDSRPYVAPVPYGSNCYASTEDGRVVALETATGNEQWTTSLGETAFLFINPTDQRLFFPTEQGSIYCLDRATGERIWRRDVGGSIETPLQFDGSQLFFGTTATDGPGTVVALDAVDGTPRWESAVPTLIKSAPALSGDAVLVRDQSGDVLAFDRETGDRQWSRAFETHSHSWSFQGPLVKNECVYTYGVDTATSQDNRLIALETKDGTTVWQREISAPVSMLASSPAHLYSVHGDSLHAVDPKDGTVHWRRELTGRSSALSVNGAVYVTNAGSVMVYDAEDGREIDRFELDGLLQGYVPGGRDEESFVGRQRPVPGGLLGMTEEAIYALSGSQGGSGVLWLAGGAGLAGLGGYAIRRWRS